MKIHYAHSTREAVVKLDVYCAFAKLNLGLTLPHYYNIKDVSQNHTVALCSDGLTYLKTITKVNM